MGTLGIIFGSSFLAGLIQGVSGFGGVVVLMTILPYFETMKDSMAISGICAMPMNISTVLLYRKKIQFRKVLLPVASYYVATLLFTKVAASMNLEAFKPIFGIFLVCLALYFMIFAKKIHVQESLRNGVLCMFAAGIAMSFFGISGPIIVMYYVAVLSDKEEYVGTLGFIFLVTNFFTTVVRYMNGFFTLALLPAIGSGTAGILLGFFTGARLIKYIDGATVKKIVYVFLAISGAITAVKGLM